MMYLVVAHLQWQCGARIEPSARRVTGALPRVLPRGGIDRRTPVEMTTHTQCKMPENKLNEREKMNTRMSINARNTR
jgi:hypothetical protein